MEEMYYSCGKNKGADQLRSYCEADFAVTAKLICAFVFTYADCWFSHAAAQKIPTWLFATKTSKIY